MVVWIGFIWLGIETSGGLLRTVMDLGVPLNAGNFLCG
jgi:hypothetical protein